MTTQSPAGRAAGLGCIVLFMLPFAATGLFTVVQGVRHAVGGEWDSAAFMGLFGLVFGLVGFGGIFAAVKARRAGAETDMVRARHAEAPWMWRADWAAGKIEDSNRSTMFAAWLFAALWNLISLPAGFFGVRQALREESYGMLFVLIFPAVGLGLLVWAIRATIRYRRFGVSRLELAAVPAPVGRSLRGTVVASGGLEVHGGLCVTLACVRRVTSGAGKNRSTSERVLWQEEQRATGRQTRTAGGWSPRFRSRSTCRPTPSRPTARIRGTRWSGVCRYRPRCPAWTTPPPSRCRSFVPPRAREHHPRSLKPRRRGQSRSFSPRPLA